MPTRLTDRFEQALQVAQDLHEDSGDNHETTHTGHLLQVAGLVLQQGGDEDQAIAALLHDALETAPSDQEVDSRRSRIRDAFGDRPATIVDACTDGPLDGHDEESWKRHKEQYIHQLWTEADEAAVRVSAADKLSTARAILRDYHAHGESAWARYEGGRSGTLWYYRALVGAFRYRDVDGFVEELDEIVSTLEEETDVA